jgi:hypothetical protein
MNCGKKAILQCSLCGSTWCKKCAEEEAIFEYEHCECQYPSIERIDN